MVTSTKDVDLKNKQTNKKTEMSEPAVTNMIYITSLGSQEEIDFARKLLNCKKPDGVNVFQPIAMVLPTSETNGDDDDDDDNNQSI